MIARAGSGWQTVLADLSLILFIVAAAAISNQPKTHSAAAVPPAAPAPPAQAEPLAIYRAAPGAMPFDRWLAEQQGDARQQLTITAQYRPGAIDAALAQAAALVREAGKAGREARVVLEPGVGGVSASLAFDAAPASLARELQNSARTSFTRRSLP